MSERLHRGIIPLAALLAVLPLLIHGPSCGHDFDFHLLSWLETSTQFAHFSFPHWAFTPGWNAGEPRFIFYPPLSWTLGGLLGLILPWTLAPAAFTWICLTLSGLSAYRLARVYAGAPAATLAATVYLANPYMLFTAYERTAYGELLAAAVMPLLFRAGLAERVRVVPVAVAVGLLWLANAPAAVMGCYALAFLTVIRLFREADKARLAGRIASGTALGMAFAAFYILPAAYERRFVQVEMVVTTGMRVSDHFLFHRMLPSSPDNDFHDAVVRTASVVALILLGAIVAALLWRRSLRGPAFPLTLLTASIAFLLTPPSLFVWNVLPQLHFLQFPWRLCALLAVVLCILVAMAIRTELAPARIALVSLLLAAILIAPAWMIFRQHCDDEDAVPARVALFHSNLGTEPTDEYTPVDADPDALHPHDPPYWLLPSSSPIDTPAPTDAAAGSAPNHLELAITTSQTLVLNRREYPGWKIELNHSAITPEVRTDGLIAIPLPPGRDVIDLHFIETPDRIAGMAVSGLSATCVAGFWLIRRRRAAAPIQ